LKKEGIFTIVAWKREQHKGKGRKIREIQLVNMWHNMELRKNDLRGIRNPNLREEPSNGGFCPSSLSKSGSTIKT